MFRSKKRSECFLLYKNYSKNWILLDLPVFSMPKIQ